MGKENKKVRFLHDVPIDRDELGVHSRLANVLKEMIKDVTDDSKRRSGNRLKNVIGLFGVWGSGKSTLIKILENKIKNKGKIFVFDSWSHKDEFIKRAFLINLAEFLQLGDISLKKFLELQKENEEDKDITVKNYLISKISQQKITKKNAPKISISLFLVISLLILTSLSNLLANLCSFATPKTITGIEVGVIIITSIILYGIFRRKKECFSSIIAPFVSGTLDVETSQITSQTMEFTNYEFQRLFKFLISEYFKKESLDSLIIVFDNLDRVDDETVLKFLSIIHSLVESKKEKDFENKIVFIVPIDKQRLLSIFNKMATENEKSTFAEDFVEKMFPYSVEIPNIKQSKWRDFFKNKFKEAFYGVKRKHMDLDLEVIIRIFLAGIEESNENLTPREIIYFINHIVSNYLYWGNKIDIKHQATYVALCKYQPQIIYELQRGERSFMEHNEIIKKVLDYTSSDALFKDLLKQIFKTERVHSILYKDKCAKYFEEGDIENARNLVSKIGDPSSIKEIWESVLEDAEEGLKSDIRILGNIAYVFSVLCEEEKVCGEAKEENILQILRSRLKELIRNREAIYTSLDATAGKGIKWLLLAEEEKKIKMLIAKLLDAFIEEAERREAS